MATNRQAFIGNLYGAKEPLRILGLFQAGSTQAIKRGEILELDTGVWIPLNADQSMSAVIAVADEEIKAGDLAGYYHILIPRPGDVFEFELAAAGATAIGTALYYSTSQKVTVSTGSHVLGYACGQENYPQAQGHAADGDPSDRGTSIKSQSYVRMTFKEAASYLKAFQVA